MNTAYPPTPPYTGGASGMPPFPKPTQKQSVQKLSCAFGRLKIRVVKSLKRLADDNVQRIDDATQRSQTGQPAKTQDGKNNRTQD